MVDRNVGITQKSMTMLVLKGSKVNIFRRLLVEIKPYLEALRKKERKKERKKGRIYEYTLIDLTA